VARAAAAVLRVQAAVGSPLAVQLAMLVRVEELVELRPAVRVAVAARSQVHQAQAVRALSPAQPVEARSARLDSAELGRAERRTAAASLRMSTPAPAQADRLAPAAPLLVGTPP
jgi:hypothetical protein